jgi:hypothetical protein
MAAKRPASFEDHVHGDDKRRHVSVDADVDVDTRYEHEKLPGEVRDATAETARRYYKQLQTYFKTEYSKPGESDGLAMYMSSAVVILAMQVELLLDAVERGAQPILNGHYYQLAEPFVDVDLHKKGNFDPRSLPVLDGAAMVHTLTAGWSDLVGKLYVHGDASCELMQFDDVKKLVRLLIKMGNKFCFKLRNRRFGGRITNSVVLGDGSKFLELEERASESWPKEP